MQITVRYVTVNCIFLYYYAYYVSCWESLGAFLSAATYTNG